MRLVGGSRSVRGTVSGRVQGVFYRASFAHEARDRGVAGWVRNLPDGGVEFLVQGYPGAVEEMLAWARQGPPSASVDQLTVQEIEADAGLDNFSIRP